MWYQNAQNFIPILAHAESSEAEANINEIWRPPLRSQGDGQGCRSAICRGGGWGVEGLLKDSDKLYTYVHCTVPSVASESLSNAPRSICPLVAPDFVRQSQGTPLPPPLPPTKTSNTHCGWGGGVGGGGLAPSFRHKILGKREN